VHLLGRFEVAKDDGPVPASAWCRRRPADLLKLLSLTPGRTLSREAVIDTLWPDKDAAGGANNLHRALYDLRQVLGGRFVDLDHGTIRLRDDVWVDAVEVDEAVRHGDLPRLREAVALYRGDLSPEDLDSAWLVPHRHRLRARFTEAAHPVARQAAEAGDVVGAIQTLRRLLRADPSHEAGVRLLMRLLAESGRRAEALAQADACSAARRAAGRDGLDAETQALRAGIEQGAVGPVREAAGQDGYRRAARRLLGTDAPAPLRGREGSLALVEALLQRGHGVVVLLGERGVGTTRLALEGARLAQARGFAVLAGVASSGPCAPGALFEDALAAERRSRPEALADPFLAPPLHANLDELRATLFTGVRQVLLAAGGGRPICLVLDDLHAADPTSLSLLHALAREAEGLRLLVLATCREDAVRRGAPVQTALTHLDTERLGRGLRVPRLLAAGSRAMLADLVGAAPADPLTEAVHQAADGRPACVEAVVAAWRHTGLVPADPRAAVRAALAHQPPAASAFLEAAAVLGRRFDAELARVAGGVSVRQAFEALEEGARAGLLDDTGEGWRLHHAMAQEALLAELPASRRRAIHAAAAEALEAAQRRPGAEPSPEPIADHWLQAGQPARALPHLLAAGHRALSRAGLAEGAPLLEDALAIADQERLRLGPGRAQALEALGQARLGLADLPALARLAETAAEPDEDGPPTPERRLRACRWAALARAAGGDLARALAIVEAGLAETGGEAPEEAAPLLHLRAQLLWHEGRFDDALLAAGGCAAVGARTADADLAWRGRELAALARAMTGAPHEPGSAPQDATGPAGRRRQDRGPEQPFDVHVVSWERDLVAGWAVSDLVRAAAALSAQAQASGDAGALAAGRTGAGLAALAGGRLEDAERLLRQAVALHREAGATLGEALALDRLAAALTARGAVAAAMAALAAGVVAGERGGLRRHALVRLHATLARTWLAAGDLHAAEAALREAAERMEDHGECLVCEAALRPELVRVALAGGRAGEAGDEVAALEALASRRGGSWLGGTAAAARGRLLAASGCHAEALHAFGRSRARFRAVGARLEAARVAHLAARCPGAEPPGGEEAALLPFDADA